MRLRLVLVCTLLLALMVTSCSDSDDSTFGAPLGGQETSTTVDSPPTVKPKPFTVAEKWWRHTDSLGDHYVHWAAVIKNPNKGHLADSPALRVTARDAAGKVLGTQDDSFDLLPPGGTIAVSGQIDASGEPASVDITYRDADWAITTTKARQYPPFQATGVSISKEEYTDDEYKVLGEINNPYPGDIDDLAVTVLLRDSEGTLVGGGTTYVEDLPAHGSVPFEASSPVSPGASPVGADVVAMTWFTFNRDWEKLAKQID